jgi:hypothetical protein
MEPAPHFLQVGAAPVFVGDGVDDLACRCAGSTLVRAHRPGTLLAISIECAACGAVTATPGLHTDQVVPFGARMVDRNRMPMSEPLVLAPGMVLVDRDELVRVDLLSQPRNVPAAPFDVTAATLAAAAAEYDRLSGGQLAAHRSAVPPDDDDTAPGLARLPLAWALGKLEANIETPGWWCLAREGDTIAAAQLGAFREFQLVWAHHPLFPAMAAGAAATGFSTHALAVFAAARCMAADGNRIGFVPPDRGERIDGFHITTGSTETGSPERVAVQVRRFDRFDWPRGRDVQVAATRAATIDALIASQSRINVRRPGIVVLSVGSVLRQHDPLIIEGVTRALHERGRRHRGLAAVALVLPKIYPTARSDQVVFGWIFMPFANPYHTGSGIRLAAPQAAAAAAGALQAGAMQAAPAG